MAWTQKADTETSLLVITSHRTPLPYLAYLRRERIPDVVAGTEGVDLGVCW